MSSTVKHRGVSDLRADENLGQFFKRVRNGGGRKPSRTLQELAEEFGVRPLSLSAKMRQDPNGPRPLFWTGGNGVKRNTWFTPDEVRAWWKKQTEGQA